jgi:tetratricopeptide (TPR) repeat protein
MKKPFFVIVGVALLGLVVGYLLLPRQGEVALMNLKDKRFETALVVLEKQSAAGDMSVQTVTSLTKLYLQEGDVEAAVALVERYLEKNPKDVAARKELGKLYQYAQRTEDYVRNLEALQQLEPSVEHLRELADIYNFRADYAKQIGVLKQLIQLEPEQTHHAVSLARIQASYGDLKAAKETLTALSASHPEALTGDTLELLLSLAADSGDVSKEVAVAGAWLAQHPDQLKVAARLASVLKYRGFPDEAWSLVQPFNAQAEQEPELMLIVVDLMDDHFGKGNEAYERLLGLHKSGKLMPALYEPLLRMSLRRGDRALARKILADAPLVQFSEFTIVDLLRLSIDQPEVAMLEQVHRQLGEGYLMSHPYTASAVAMLEKRSDVASRVQRLLGKEALGHPQLLQLSWFAARTGHGAESRLLLDRLKPYESLRDDELVALSDVHTLLSQPDELLPLIEARRAKAPSNAMDVAWVKLSTAAGRFDAVQAWFASKAESDLSDQLLYDIYFAASDAGQHVLAHTAAKMLFGRQDTPNHRYYLASSLAKSGQYAEALTLVEPLIEHSEDAESLYISMLGKVGVKDKTAAAKLTKLLTAKLQDNSLPEKRKQEIVYALLQFGAADTVLPQVRQMADSRGGEWLGMYEATLTKLGRHDELMAYRLKRLENPKLSPDQRREIGHYMLDQGKKDVAARVFMQLADLPNPKQADIAQLFYILGPRPSKEATEWVAHKASSATGEVQLQWLDHLASIGQADRALALMQKSGVPQRAVDDPRLFEMYSRALLGKKSYGEVSKLVRARADRSKSVAELRGLTKLAVETGQLEAAAYVSEKIVAQNPNDTDALRNLGAFAFSQSAYSISESYFERYFRQGRHDYQSDFYYGELLWRKGKTSEASEYYRRARVQMGKGKKDLTMQAVDAQIEYRVGDKNQAFGVFRQLMQRSPSNVGIRADFIGVLLENFVYGEARQLLGNS